LPAHHFVFDIPQPWWSRPYEYAWASSFARPEDIALDAASGIEHPFKFFLLDQCRESYACDIDPRILDHQAILDAVSNAFGHEAEKSFADRYLYDVNYSHASLTELPYEDGYFDRIYCISVLEHLKDKFNKWPWLVPFRNMLPSVPHTIEQAMTEFKRTLKDDGLIVLTFDYPRINLGYFQRIVQDLGLEFAGSTDFNRPSNALYSEKNRLYCFRAVVRKLQR